MTAQFGSDGATTPILYELQCDRLGALLLVDTDPTTASHLLHGTRNSPEGDTFWPNTGETND